MRTGKSVIKRILFVIMCLVITTQVSGLKIFAEEIVETEKTGKPVESGKSDAISVETRFEIIEHDDTGASNDNLFAGYVERQFYGEPEETILGDVAGKRLTGNNLLAYNTIKEKIAKIASGEITSTVINIPLKDVLNGKLEYSASDLGISESDIYDNTKRTEAINRLIGIDYDLVINAIRFDFPYEMYWYGNECSYTSVAAHSYSVEGVRFREDTNLEVCMKVCEDYADSENYTTDGTKTGATSSAVSNANSIVTAAAGKSDMEKLEFFRDKICELTTYNDDAAAGSYEYEYGNPWQMIWVFDGEPSTTVVCEGYSKAFQYLCDKSQFKGNIYSYIATGQMVTEDVSGPHMWNIVHMDDNRNYLVDITNIDDDSIGAEGYALFLKPAKTKGTDYYEFEAVGGTVKYSYESETIKTYSEEELTLSMQAYAGPVHGANTSIWEVDAENHWHKCSISDCTEHKYDLASHSFVKQINEEITGQCVTKETCADKGVYKEYCSVCNELGSNTFEIDALGHIWDDGTVTKQPTYSEKGIKTFKCKREGCGGTKEEEIPLLSHEHTWNSIYKVDKPATCTEQGSKAIYCEVCGEKKADSDKAIPALGHVWKGEITKAPTYTEKGVKTYTCQNDNSHTMTIEIPTLEVIGDIVDDDISENTESDVVKEEIRLVGVKDAVTYTGSAITFDVRAYKGNKLLKEGTDYSLKYKNNKNACTDISDANKEKAPTVMLTGKGLYKNQTAEKRFVINKVDLNNLASGGQAVVSNDVVVYNANKKYTPVPSITINGKKLRNGADYKVEYVGFADGYESVGTYSIKLTGNGNYEGELTSIFKVVDKNAYKMMSSAKVTGYEKSFVYDGSAKV